MREAVRAVILSRADCFGCLKRPASGKDREPEQQGALGWGKQIVRPVNGSLEGLLAGKGGAAAAGQQKESMVQAACDLLDRKHARARRSQLNRQRDTV